MTKFSLLGIALASLIITGCSDPTTTARTEIRRQIATTQIALLRYPADNTIIEHLDELIVSVKTHRKALRPEQIKAVEEAISEVEKFIAAFNQAKRISLNNELDNKPNPSNLWKNSAELQISCQRKLDLSLKSIE